MADQSINQSIDRSMNKELEQKCIKQVAIFERV